MTTPRDYTDQINLSNIQIQANKKPTQAPPPSILTEGRNRRRMYNMCCKQNHII